MVDRKMHASHRLDASNLVVVGGVSVPRRFTLTVNWSGDGADFDMVAQLRAEPGEVYVTSVQLRSEEGLPLKRLQEEWRWEWIRDQAVAMHSADPTTGVPNPIQYTQARRALRAAAKTGDRDAHYRRVAEVYRGFDGRNVVQHVQQTMLTSYGTARRWINEARSLVDPETGRPYLEPAPAPGKRSR